MAAFDTTTGSILPWDPKASSSMVNAFLVNGSTVFVGGSFTSAGQGPGNFLPIDISTGLWLSGY